MKALSLIASTLATGTIACATLLTPALAIAAPVNGGMPGNDLDSGKCVAPAAASLSKKGITDATLVQIQVRQNGSEVPMPQGYDFYYTSPSCGGNGYIVVTTTDYCYTQQVYTRFSCNIAGVSHFSF